MLHHSRDCKISKLYLFVVAFIVRVKTDYFLSDLSVNVKWQNIMGSVIKVTKGLRQGGLTSPMLYNVFYQPLVDKLSSCNAGIVIHNQKYDVFCYADDLLALQLQDYRHKLTSQLNVVMLFLLK